MSIADLFYRIATGPKRRRAQLTPVGLLVFAGTIVVVIGGGLVTDRILRLPAPLPGVLALAAGGPVLVAGMLLTGWCVVRFGKARGTPVPLNPPEVLITDGPYGWVRNPMVTGVFAMLFGLGLVLRSTGIALIWTPAYVLLHWIELTRIEEPELARRFGAAYSDYAQRVPRFVPRPPRRRDRRAPPDTA